MEHDKANIHLIEISKAGTYIEWVKFMSPPAEDIHHVSSSHQTRFQLQLHSRAFRKPTDVTSMVFNDSNTIHPVRQCKNTKYIEQLTCCLPHAHMFHKDRFYILTVPWELIDSLIASETAALMSAKELRNSLVIERDRTEICIKSSAGKLPCSANNIDILKNSIFSHGSVMNVSVSIILLEEPLDHAVRLLGAIGSVESEVSTVQETTKAKENVLQSSAKEFFQPWESLYAMKPSSVCLLASPLQNCLGKCANGTEFFHDVLFSDTESQMSARQSAGSADTFQIPRLNIPVSKPSLNLLFTARRAAQSGGDSAISRYEPLISCIIPFRLYVGGEKPCTDASYLRAAGITTIVNLSPETCKYELLPNFKYYSFDVRDTSHFNITNYFEQIFEIIDAPLTFNQKQPKCKHDETWKNSAFAPYSSHKARVEMSAVYLHCQKGVSRSVTVAVAYCVWKFGLSVRECLRMIKGGVLSGRNSDSPAIISPSYFTARSDWSPKYVERVYDPMSPKIMHEISYIRPIAQPNAGFTLQLYNFAKKCKAEKTMRSSV